MNGLFLKVTNSSRIFLLTEFVTSFKKQNLIEAIYSQLYLNIDVNFDLIRIKLFFGGKESLYYSCRIRYLAKIISHIPIFPNFNLISVIPGGYELLILFLHYSLSCLKPIVSHYFRKRICKFYPSFDLL